MTTESSIMGCILPRRARRAGGRPHWTTMRPRVQSRPTNARQVMFAPCIEHHQRPEDLSVISHPTEVFAHQALCRVRIEQPDMSHSLGRQTIFERSPQWSTHPQTKRRAKPLLTPSEDRWRQQIMQRASQDILGLPTHQLQSRWDATRQLHHGPVEKRRPDLETTGHGCPIGGDQVLSGKIELAVLIDAPIHGIRAWRCAKGGHQLVVRFKLDARVSHILRQEARTLQRGEPSEPQLGPCVGHIWEAAEKLLEQEFDTAVPGGWRHAADAAGRRSLKPLRETLQPLRRAMRQKRGIPAEQLVTSIAAQHHGDAPSGLLRYPIKQE